jgi:hypothetical protein
VTWGPWAPGIKPDEVKARLRALRALALVFARHHASIHYALRLAEQDPATRLEFAQKIFDHDLTALARRRILATYSDLASYGRSSQDPKSKGRSKVFGSTI